MLQTPFPKQHSLCCVTALSGSDPGICRGLVLGSCLSLNCCSKPFWVATWYFRGISGSKVHIEQGSGPEPRNQLLLHCIAASGSVSWGDLTASPKFTCPSLEMRLICWGGSEQEPAASRQGLPFDQTSLKAYHQAVMGPVLFEMTREKRWSNVIKTQFLVCCRSTSKSPVWDLMCKPCTDIFPKDLHTPARLFLKLKRLQQLLLSCSDPEQVNGHLPGTLLCAA